MINGRKVLGLVTARGGSKGLPGKNLLKVGGMSLTARAVRSGTESRYVDRVVISTDSAEIAQEAENFGCGVPFMRPCELATDGAKSIDVIRHALETLKEQGESYDVFVLLQPTSPFRTAFHVDACLELMDVKGADSVVSVAKAEHHPLNMNTLPDDMCMKNFIRTEAENRNRQDLPDYYRLNGAVYAVSCGYMLESGRLFSERSYAYLMSAEDSVDVDSKLDLKLAQLLVQEK